jgi:hypothetical protein
LAVDIVEVVVVDVVVVVTHSGLTGLPSSLLQLMNRWEPSFAKIT